MNYFRIFIVEDDPFYGQLLKYHLTMNPDYEVSLFPNAKACLEKIHLKPAVVCIDFNLPDLTGSELMKKIKSQNVAIPIIIISGQEDIAVALDLLKQGAYDYIIKNDNTKELLWNSILKLRENLGLKSEVESLKAQLIQKFDFEKTIIGQSPAIKKCFTLVEKAIKNNINVSITGETGTGKELIAKAIHYNSDRRKMPFIAVNMSAIPKDLIESELFGYEKGAFTGALSRKLGKFEEADGGTIFLDEIAEADLNLQAKLLRVLQEREIVRVGSNKPVKFDVRLISATHKDLAHEVKNGHFREDLFYRIMGLPIELPPLRERGNDVLILARYFADAFVRENHQAQIGLSAAAKEKLLKYAFPGNVRELKAVIDLACVMSDSVEIQEADLTLMNQQLNPDHWSAMTESTLKDYTVRIIEMFLSKYNQNVVEVAKRLDISKSTIYNMISSGEVKGKKI